MWCLQTLLKAAYCYQSKHIYFYEYDQINLYYHNKINNLFFPNYFLGSQKSKVLVKETHQNVFKYYWIPLAKELVQTIIAEKNACTKFDESGSKTCDLLAQIYQHKYNL